MNERGFTLIELIAAIGIMGLIVPVLASSARQIFVFTERNNTAVTALVQVEGGARVLGKDIRIAQNTELIPDAAPANSMTLYWIDWSDEGNYDVYGEDEIVYSTKRAVWNLSGTNLERIEGMCRDWDSDTVSCDVAWVDGSPRVVARYVTSAEFSLDTAGQVITATFVSSPNSTLGTASSKSYDLKVFAPLLGAEDPVR